MGARRRSASREGWMVVNGSSGGNVEAYTVLFEMGDPAHAGSSARRPTRAVVENNRLQKRKPCCPA
jgi:hypothetical protein